MNLEFDQLQDLALLAFEAAALKELRGGRILCGGGYSNEDSLDILGQSSFMTRKVVEGLVDRRLVKKVDIGSYEISARGLSYLQKERKDDDSFLVVSGARVVSQLLDDLPGWEAYGYAFFLDTRVKGVIPASDRSVALTHNQPDYQEVVAALDKVVEEFRDDHRLDNELGYEKGALLKALEAGRELLNDTVVNVRIGTALLIEPLQRLVVKYQKELVGALASAAIPLVLKLLGLGN